MSTYNPDTRPDRALPSELVVVFVGEINDGKSFQWASAALAERPDGSPLLDGIVLLNAESSTRVTIDRVVRDPRPGWDGRVHVCEVSRVADVARHLRDLGLLRGHGPAKRLPNGRRIDAVVLDSASGLARRERDFIHAELKQASDKHPTLSKLPDTSKERPENDDKRLWGVVTNQYVEVVTHVHDAAHSNGLLAMITCHSAERYEGDDEKKAWIGKRLHLPKTIRQSLRAAANFIWYMHSITPNYRNMDAAAVNAARTSNDPRLKKRHAAITEGGTYDEHGNLDAVCKRQGDDEGTHFQKVFGSLVPTYWHPDHVKVPDQAPCAQPDFGKILEFALFNRVRGLAEKTSTTNP